MGHPMVQVGVLSYGFPGNSLNVKMRLMCVSPSDFHVNPFKAKMWLCDGGKEGHGVSQNEGSAAMCPLE